jgi:hypothetical protein
VCSERKPQRDSFLFSVLRGVCLYCENAKEKKKKKKQVFFFFFFFFFSSSSFVCFVCSLFSCFFGIFPSCRLVAECVFQFPISWFELTVFSLLFNRRTMEEVENAPNRLFISYLTRLRDKSIKRNDRRSAQVYEKAVASLKLYPLPLRSVQEAGLIKNIGPKVLADLEACAVRYGADIKSKKRPKQNARKREAMMEEVLVSDPNPEVEVQSKRSKQTKKTSVNQDVVVDEYVFTPVDKVVLVVDFRELARKRGARLKAELERVGVEFESRGLGLGDMAWIVKDSKGKERMLRHVVEV